MLWCGVHVLRHILFRACCVPSGRPLLFLSDSGIIVLCMIILANIEPLTLVDYILFIKANVDLDPSPNEVQATQYVSADKLKELFEDPSLKFTPWFKLICNSMLFEWWENLDTGLDKYLNEQSIRRML